MCGHVKNQSVFGKPKCFVDGVNAQFTPGDKNAGRGARIEWDNCCLLGYLKERVHLKMEIW